MSQMAFHEKLRGEKVRSGIAYPGLRDILVSGIGGLLVIGLLSFLSFELDFQTFIVPFGASAVLVFAAPTAPFSQPRNVIGGHLISALSGMAAFALFDSSAWWVLAAANGLAIALMVATKTVHPPAGATSLLPVLNGVTSVSWPFAPVVLGAVILVLVGVLYNNVWKQRHYPTFWF